MIEREKELYKMLNTNKNNDLISIYKDIQEFYEIKFGKNTVVFIEIGTFYEVYQTEEFGKAKEMSSILNIQLTRRNKSIKEISNKNPYMTGVPGITKDKYLNILMKENKWTIVLIKQERKGELFFRSLDKIISPGTNIDYINGEEESFFTSIYIEKNHEGVLISGVTATDVTTGKVFIRECFGTREDKKLPLDDINDFLTSYKTKELIIRLEGLEEDFIKKNLNLINFKHHFIHKSSKKDKISYQNKLLKKIFHLESFLSPIEDLDLEFKNFALISLINSCEFLIEHDINLVNRLKKPHFILSDMFLDIGNNSLEQLNISTHFNKTSVIDIVNYTKTYIGKRLLKERVLNPIINVKEIQNRYDITNFILKNKKIIKLFSKEMSEIYDIERLFRRVTVGNIDPFEFMYLHLSFKKISNFLSNIKNNYSNFENLFIDSNFENLIEECENIIENIEKSFDMEELHKYKLKDIESNILNIENNTYIKELIEISNSFDNTLNLEISKIKNIITEEEGDLKLDFINIESTDKEGFYININRRKFEKYLEKKIDGKEYHIKKLKSSVKLFNTVLEEYSLKKNDILNKIIIYNKKEYLKFISNFSDNFFNSIEGIIKIISEIDVFCSSAILVEKNNYTIPHILDEEDSFIEAIELRHPIIEKIEKNGIYVPNDIILGDKKYSKNKKNIIFENSDKTKGVLLYGINSSGKSSFTKSIGISIILAQSGLPVPSSYFKYSIFRKIFTRITGSDNLYLGQSTFFVEMIELKNILNRCGDKSLILGDEISHGTETVSGLSIVASAVKKLSEKNNLFMFSTHLHQLPDLEIIKNIKEIQHLHLSVHYEEKTKNIIYDRKLKLGSGSSVYGLEFAKYLNMDKSFIDLAYKIRNEISGDLNDKEYLIKKETSNYNKNVYMDNCFFCNNKAEETHHLIEQKNSNEHGNIGIIHKNHSENLLPLCKKHHKIIHQSNCSKLKGKDEKLMEWVTTSSGKKLWINPCLVEEMKIGIDIKDDLISY